MTQLGAREPGIPSPGAGQEPQTLWDKILHYTPVVMTVVATVLAGLSSSEMNRAQYFRALASQNQSKVGDQWAFFQAKRTRTILAEKTREVLEALTAPEPVEPETIQALANDLPAAFQSAAREADQLQQAVGRLQEPRPPSDARTVPTPTEKESWQKALERFRQVTSAGTAEAENVRKKTADTLAALALQAPKDPRLAVFTWLNSDQLPPVEDQHVDDPVLTRVQQAIQERKPESELAPLLREVNSEKLQQAVNVAEANAAAADTASKPVDRALQNVETLVDGQVRLARQFYRADQELQRALRGVSGEEKPLPDDIRGGLDRLHRQAAALKTAADEVNTAVKSAGDRLSARRYERDARYNQEAAYLYEVQVYENSYHSDRHLNRSRNFFYGMLLAQVAVTTATLALAVRKKNVLWGLASLAGIAAVAYSVYVYLDLLP
jgi:hypothetical protein